MASACLRFTCSSLIFQNNLRNRASFVQIYFVDRIDFVSMLAIPLKRDLERGHPARLEYDVCEDAGKMPALRI
jgi:hypothetical protein